MTRSMKTQTIVIAAVITALSTWVIYQKHFQIAARIWQIEHHGLLTFAGYSIPVPRNWYVEEHGTNSQGLIRLDSAHRPTDNSWYPHATITLTDEPPITEIDKWTSLVISSFKSTGADPALRHMVSADGETFSCVGGEILPKPPGRNDPVPIGWHCRS